jgi:hypothetical protein
MKTFSEEIRDLADDRLIARLNTMRRLSEGDRPHWGYNLNMHTALLDECKRRGLEVADGQ